jgi:hypothetical protein
MIELDDLTFVQLFWLLFGIIVSVLFFCNWTAAYWNFGY